jgi:hypothetical protein
MTSLEISGSTCGVCKGKKARVLVCGHRHHMKCLKRGLCVDCGEKAKTTPKAKLEEVKEELEDKLEVKETKKTERYIVTKTYFGNPFNLDYDTEIIGIYDNKYEAYYNAYETYIIRISIGCLIHSDETGKECLHCKEHWMTLENDSKGLEEIIKLFKTIKKGYREYFENECDRNIAHYVNIFQDKVEID